MVMVDEVVMDEETDALCGLRPSPSRQAVDDALKHRQWVLQAGNTAQVDWRERLRDILDQLCRARYLIELFFLL
jgi:hypothetical protein